jgi:hypothetical protein
MPMMKPPDDLKVAAFQRMCDCCVPRHLVSATSEKAAVHSILDHLNWAIHRDMCRAIDVNPFLLPSESKP